MKIIIINGPNLASIGKRETLIYGNQSFDDYLDFMREKFSDITIDYFQSNIEGEIIDKLYHTQGEYCGVVLNAGGYSHTSVAIRDAIASISTLVVEVHISNLLKREDFRHSSIIAPVCAGSIMGFGLMSYLLGINSLIDLNLK